MNEQIEIPDTPTPNILEKNTKETGGKRLNRVAIWVICALIALPLLSFVYTGELRSAMSKARATASDTEKYKVSNVASAPARPAGPDVPLPKTPVHYMPGEVNASGVPMQDSESERIARDKKLAALDAALSAPAEVEKFATRRQGTNNATPTAYGSAAGVRIDGTVPPPPGNGSGEDGMGSIDQDQGHKRAFLQGGSNEYSPYLKHTRKQSVSQFVVNAGFIIPGITISGINSDLPGLIVGQVRQNVYDSATGNHLLIPAGARLVGTYDSEVSGGQERALVAWNRIIFPDSSSVYLETMPGADQSGIAGFKDQVNNHYLRTFGQAFMLSLFSAGMQLSQPRGSVQGTYNAQQIGAAALGQQMAQLGMQLARRNLSRQPTLEIRPGFEFTIMVNKDMILPVWKGHPMAVSVATQQEMQ